QVGREAGGTGRSGPLPRPHGADGRERRRAVENQPGVRPVDPLTPPDRRLFLSSGSISRRCSTTSSTSSTSSVLLRPPPSGSSGFGGPTTGGGGGRWWHSTGRGSRTDPSCSSRPPG